MSAWVRSIDEIKKNIVEYCGSSAERISILKAVRKAVNYKQVSKTTGIYPTTCSTILKAMVPYGLVEEIGKRKGIYRQTPDVRGLNIDSVVRKGLAAKGGNLVINRTKSVAINFPSNPKMENPGLPVSVLHDATRMQEVYPYLYLFENSVRYFIKDTLEARYGAGWWDSKASNPTRQKAAERELKDGANRWHGKRGAHPIFYVDIEDLIGLISSNFVDFRDKMPSVKRPLEWVSQRIEEITLSRNIVAHNNPLSQKDISRLKIYYSDWVDQIR